MDPLTIGAFFVWLVEGIASEAMREAARNEPKRAGENAASEEDRFRKAREEYALQVLQTTRAVNALEEQRSESARRILSKTVKVADRLASNRSAFTKSDGWFGGQSFADVERFVKLAETFETRTSARNMVRTGSDAALALAQAVRLLEKAFPNLDEIDLQYIVASLPFAGADELADNLGGIGEIGASELLGFVGLLLSGAALLKAQEEASKIRARAREISNNANKISEVSMRLKDVEQNCADVREQLRMMDYNQFKLAWASEQLIKRHPPGFGLPKRYRRIVDAFADHTKLYWATLLTEAQSTAREATHV